MDIKKILCSIILAALSLCGCGTDDNDIRQDYIIKLSDTMKKQVKIIKMQTTFSNHRKIFRNGLFPQTTYMNYIKIQSLPKKL